MDSVGTESLCIVEHGGWVNGRMKASVLLEQDGHLDQGFQDSLLRGRGVSHQLPFTGTSLGISGKRLSAPQISYHFSACVFKIPFMFGKNLYLSKQLHH